MPLPIVHDAERTRWISFNRPDKLNALKRTDILAATSAVSEIPEHVRAIVFTGTGPRAFSAGVHVDEFRALSPSGARDFITAMGNLIGAARKAPVATLCAVDGYCLGGAMELAAACDLRIATTNAVFGMPEIKVGIPSVLDAALLQQHLGLSKAKEMVLTGNLYPAMELERYGFINKLVPPEELEDATMALVQAVSRHSRPALASQKRLFEMWQNMGLQASIDASVGEFAEVFSHPGTLEQVAAYRAGRA